MVKITTAKGKQLEADKVTTVKNPPLLFANIVNTPVADVAKIFTNPKELPIEGYPDFTEFQSLSISTNGVQIVLKKEIT